MTAPEEEAMAELTEILSRDKKDFQGVYEFLQAHPECAKVKCCPCPFPLDRKLFPLIFLVKTKAPLSMVKDVYEMFPSAIDLAEDEPEDNSPLREAIFVGASFDVVSFLVEKDKGAVFRSGREESLAISDLVCGQYVVGITGCDCPDFEKIARHLVAIDPQSMDRVDDSFELSLFDHVLLKTTNDDSSFLLWLADLAVERLGRITTVCIPMAEDEPEYCETERQKNESILQNINLILSTFQKGKFDLEFRAHLTSDSRPTIRLSSIGNVFSGVTIPPTTTVAFTCWDILGSFRLEAIDWDSCRLEKLLFEVCEMSNDSFSSLLSGLQCLPCLKELKLFHLKQDFLYDEEQEIDEGTEAVIQLLQGSPTLKYLSVSGMPLLVDTEQITAALATSSDSTAYFAYNFPPNRTIALLSSLNYHGRAKISSPGATPAHLIQSLVSLKNDNRLPKDLVSSVRFGLLMASPGVWATTDGVPVSPMKRRAPVQLSNHKLKTSRQSMDN